MPPSPHAQVHLSPRWTGGFQVRQGFSGKSMGSCWAAPPGGRRQQQKSACAHSGATSLPECDLRYFLRSVAVLLSE